jgi:transcription initiation factor TFIID TATA-box-binding protein
MSNELDLSKLAIGLETAEYEPEIFPGLIYRLKDPKAATLIFSSGKVVCTGAKTLEAVGRAFKIVVTKLLVLGIPVVEPLQYEVQNIVASADLGQPLNLNAIAVTFGLERVEYEPEQFPGLVYRMAEPRVVILLFGSGKLVCTGARSVQQAEAAVSKITEELRSVDLMSKGSERY